MIITLLYPCCHLKIFSSAQISKNYVGFQIRWHFSWQKSFLGSLIKLHDNNLPLFNLGRNTIIICVRNVFIQENLTALAIINYLQVRRITRASEQWASLGRRPHYNFKKQLLVFIVTPFKIDQNQNQNCSID